MKRKKNPLWYRIGVLIFGGIFCFSSYMAGRDICEARKEAAAFRKLSEAGGGLYGDRGTEGLHRGSGG